MPCSYSGGGYALELVLGDFHDSNGTLEASGMARACDSRLGVVGEHGRTVRVCVLVGTLDADGGCMPEAGAGDDLPALASGVHAMAHMALDANGGACCSARLAAAVARSARPSVRPVTRQFPSINSARVSTPGLGASRGTTAVFGAVTASSVARRVAATR